LCGRERRRRVAQLAETQVFRCECAFVACDPLPDIASPSAGSSSVLTPEDFTTGRILGLSAASAKPFADLARARHARYAADLGRPPGRLLEIGCGAAGLAEELQRLGVAYHGLDLDPRPLEAARERGVQSLRVGDFLDLSDEEPYDVICLSQVLEHVKRPRELISKARRWLVPGGLIHIDVPNHGGLAGLPSRFARGLNRRFGAIEWPHHAFAYDRTSLAAALGPDFRAKVFTATPADPTWGQGVIPTLLTRGYYASSRLLRAHSLVIGYGPRR
jgi:SAM-dependent methyltransferase